MNSLFIFKHIDPRFGKETINTEAIIVYADHGVRYKKEDRKGFLLILDFHRKARKGNHEDVSNLQKFFEGKLGFDIWKESDRGKDELYRKLEGVKDYLAKSVNKYYCFFCVVMSHGDEKGIMTQDEEYFSMEDLFGFFDNKELPGFAGRPRVYIVQACRGKQTHPRIETDNKPTGNIPDVRVSSTSVPKESDIIFLYSTTPGTFIGNGSDFASSLPMSIFAQIVFTV
ncbi:hypothetical protein ScPMuIL_010376 [Solemya velum]